MEHKPTLKISKRTVDALPVPVGHDYFAWDESLGGFFVRVYPTGRKGYGIQYRNRHGRTRRLLLGTHGRLTPSEARAEAKVTLGNVARGEDPSETRSKERHSPTVEDLAKRYMKEHARPKKKPSSIVSDERLLRLVVNPELGRLKVSSVTEADIDEMHQKHKKTPTQANRALALAHKMFRLAEKWKLRPKNSNPCSDTDRYPETARKRFLSPAELGRLGDALAEAEREKEIHSSAALAVKLMILTGCRRSEILDLEWSEVDLPGRKLSLDDSKTGAKDIALGPPALLLLKAAEREKGNPYVCWGLKKGQRFIGIDRAWRALRKRADLPGLRLHDLRHSFAAVGAKGGESLLIIGKLLGHKQPSTTARYAHLADDAKSAAADRISEEIAASMEGRPAAEVTEIDDHRKAR